MKHKKEIKKFDSTELRKWAKEIERLKNDIEGILTEPMKNRTQFNLPKWNKMNGQQKKLFVFRAIELGFITWEIKSYSKLGN